MSERAQEATTTLFLKNDVSALYMYEVAWESYFHMKRDTQMRPA